MASEEKAQKLPVVEAKEPATTFNLKYGEVVVIGKKGGFVTTKADYDRVYSKQEGFSLSEEKKSS